MKISFRVMSLFSTLSDTKVHPWYKESVSVLEAIRGYTAGGGETIIVVAAVGAEDGAAVERAVVGTEEGAAVGGAVVGVEEGAAVGMAGSGELDRQLSQICFIVRGEPAVGLHVSNSAARSGS